MTIFHLRCNKQHIWHAALWLHRSADYDVPPAVESLVGRWSADTSSDCACLLLIQGSSLFVFGQEKRDFGSVVIHKCCFFTHVCLCHCRCLVKHRPQLSVSLMKCNVILCPSCSSGSLIQLPSVERGKLSKVRLGSLSLKKEGERQCFLFTKHFLVCTRSSGGKLHLLKVRIP